MKNIAYVFQTKNNYNLFDPIFFRKSKCSFDDIYMFNIDLGSTPENLAFADLYLKSRNIIDITPKDDPNVNSCYRAIDLTIDYIEKHNLDIDWVVWACHDTSIPDKDFFNKFDKFVEKDERILKQVGVISFQELGVIEENKPMFGQTCLLKNSFDRPRFGGWLQNMPESYDNQDYYLIESSPYEQVAINRHLYKQFIYPGDYNFVLFYFGPDLSYEFALQNIPSIVVPELIIIDEWRAKQPFGVTRALVGDPQYHNESGKEHWNTWKKKWKFWYPCPPFTTFDKIREEFQDNIELYKGTLIEKFYQWSVYDGPKKLEDIEDLEWGKGNDTIIRRRRND